MKDERPNLIRRESLRVSNAATVWSSWLIRAAFALWPGFAIHAATPGDNDLAAALSAAAPKADPGVIGLATHALSCVRRAELAKDPQTLSVIDYSRPSTEPRLWVFDLAHPHLLFEELVAHGRNSGDNNAIHFSNAPGSLMSSIGMFLTADTYVGHNGYSLRLRGLEPGFNDKALDRDIVIHGAAYVNPLLTKTLGRIGRSFGCPAVRPEIARALIDAIRNGSLVFAYYPDQRWLHASSLVGNCDVLAAQQTPNESPTLASLDPAVHSSRLP